MGQNEAISWVSLLLLLQLFLQFMFLHFDNNYFISRIEESTLEELNGIALQQNSSVFSYSTIYLY